MILICVNLGMRCGLNPFRIIQNVASCEALLDLRTQNLRLRRDVLDFFFHCFFGFDC